MFLPSQCCPPPPPPHTHHPLPSLVGAAVCVILARAFHPRVSALVLATFACYAAFTVLLTWVAAGIRRRVKELDNEITGERFCQVVEGQGAWVRGSAR